MRRALTLFLLLVAGLLAACGKNNNSTPNAQLRFFLAIPDSTAVNVRLNSDTTNFQSGISYQSLSAYKDITAGSQTLNVLDSNGVTELTSGYTFGGASKYTLILNGRAASAGGLLLQDDTTNPASGNFKIRMVNVGSISVDFYLLTSAQNVATSSPTTLGVGVGTTNNYTEIAKGDYRIVLTVPGSKDVVYDSGVSTYADQAVVTMIAYATGSSKLVNGAIINGTTLTLPTNPYARIKTVQTTPDVPLMDVLVDNVVTFSNVPYQASSSYTTVNSGTHGFKAQATATPGTFLANTNLTLGGGKDYTIVTNGKQGIVTLVQLTDVNFTPGLNKARVRVVNAGLGGTSVDTLVNFVKQLSATQVNGASDYLELDANTYAFTFTNSGTTQAVVSLPSVTLTAGTRYTIYLVGSSPNLQGAVTVDN